MRPAPVVEVQVVIEHILHRDHAGEEAPPELHPPQLAEDGALQPLDEPIGPRVPGFGPGVSHPQLPTGLIERSTVLIALVAEHALHRPSRPGVVGDDFSEELGRRLGRELCGQARHRVRAGGIAGRVLPDLAHALQLANIERVK